jgi:hypothetical protein
MGVWLNSLPRDTVVQSRPGACYLVDEGVKIIAAHGLTIDGGTWRDDSDPPIDTSRAGQSVLWFAGGSDVTVENLTIEGVNPGGGFHVNGAFQAGIRSDGVVGLNVDHVTVAGTFGDGLELTPLRGEHDTSGEIIRPTENVNADGLAVFGVGRNGVTLASVTNATLTDVHFFNIGLDDFDAESDQQNEGATHVTIDGCSAYGSSAALFASGGFSGGRYTGDITVENCTMEAMQNGFAVYGREPSWARRPKGPITFTNDLLICGHSAYVACVDISGEIVTVTNSQIWVPPGYAGEAAYSAHDRAALTFDDDTVIGYGSLGTVDQSSTVTVQGGVWLPYPA